MKGAATSLDGSGRARTARTLALPENVETIPFDESVDKRLAAPSGRLSHSRTGALDACRGQ